MHVNASGIATLLHQVVLMRTADDPPQLVLVTRDELLANFGGVAIRDGEEVGRRITSPVYPFSVAMTGALGGTLIADPMVVGFDDPLNPFVHRFHPDHDNLNDRYEPLPVDDPVTARNEQETESYTITRDIELEFVEVDFDTAGNPNWGVTQLGGEYRETITGIHKRALSVSGTFRLHRISDVAILNNGL